MAMVLRSPVVAGKFYPAQPERLASQVQEMLKVAREPVEALGVMVPHAGYVYSGAAAGETFARVRIPHRVVLLGPNHTGRGPSISAAADDGWDTPLGRVGLARDLLTALAGVDPAVQSDRQAHFAEHCLEVQLPFLQTLQPELEIAPIVVGTHRLEELLQLGAALAGVIEAQAERPLIVISSDMTHYESAASARAKDFRAIERLEQIDPSGLHQTVLGGNITMCGIAPAVAGLEALRRLGAKRGELAVYTHSGMVTGDDREVVAYAGMVFRA